jgi:Mrp family chromosome partitioning ATPase
LPTALLLTGVTSSETIGSVAVELVRSLSESGLRTVLVDADLNVRAASAQLSLLEAPGLAESLNGQGEEAHNPAVAGAALLKTVGLSVLPAGAGATDPALALSGTRLGETVEVLRDRFDIVLIAGPNLDRVAEVIPLLEWADHALLLVPRGIQARRLGPARMIGDNLGRRFVGALILDSER